ncbi:AF4/FMR2 family member 3, partial [Operophtera brumata]
QSPISELSDSEASSPSPGSRRRSNTHRTSTGSSDDDTPSHHAVRIKPYSFYSSVRCPLARNHALPSEIFIAPNYVFTPIKEGGGKGGKGGKGKGGKGKGQVTIIEVTAPEPDDDERRRSADRRNEEALARVSPPPEPEPLPRRRELNERIQDRVSIERAEHRRSDDRHDRVSKRTSNDRIPTERTSNDRIRRLSSDRSRDRTPSDRLSVDRAERMALDRRSTDRSSSDRTSDRSSLSDRSMSDRLSVSGHSTDRRSTERLSSDKLSLDRLPTEKISHERLEKLSHERMDSKLSVGRLPDTKMLIDRHVDSKMAIDRLTDSKMAIDMVPDKMMDRITDSKLSILPDNKLSIDKLSMGRLTDMAATNHERTGACSGQTPIYYSYFERLPADALSDEERDHKYYLKEATRLRTAAESEQEPLARVMLYLESVLCFVLTGRVLDTKGAFTVYRETIEYIRLIHSMPQRFRASPHDTFNKLDILR